MMTLDNIILKQGKQITKKPLKNNFNKSGKYFCTIKFLMPKKKKFV